MGFVVRMTRLTRLLRQTWKSVARLARLTFIKKGEPPSNFYIFVSDVSDVPRFTTSGNRRRVRRGTLVRLSCPTFVV